MDFATLTDTPEQAELRAVIRDFLGTRAAASAPASETEDVWKRLTGQLGLTSLAVPEESGATLAEVMVAVEEIGRVLLPVPYLSTALTAVILAEAGVDDFLPGLMDGTLIGALAFGPGVTTLSGDRINGTVRHVLDGPKADVFLVRAAGAVVAVRAADAVITPVGTLDQTRGQAEVRFTDAPSLRIGDSAFTERAEGLLWTALAAESAAAAAQCLDVTVDYLKTRVQFGRPIGEFQALKHRCADLAVKAESARMTAHAAVRAAMSDPSEFAVAAPLAKRYCADVFFDAAAEMIQLHGGIGFTWEHPAHLYLKRAKAASVAFGTPGAYRAALATLVNLPGPGA